MAFDFAKSIRQISESYKKQVFNKAKYEKDLLKEELEFIDPNKKKNVVKEGPRFPTKQNDDPFAFPEDEFGNVDDNFVDSAIDSDFDDGFDFDFDDFSNDPFDSRSDTLDSEFGPDFDDENPFAEEPEPRRPRASMGRRKRADTWDWDYEDDASSYFQNKLDKFRNEF